MLRKNSNFAGIRTSKILAVLILFLLGFTLVHTAFGDVLGSLLTNGDFETGSTSPWRMAISGSGNAATLTITDDAFNGKHAGRIAVTRYNTFSSFSGGYVSFSSPALNPTAGKTYLVTFTYKASARFEAYFLCKNGNTQVYSKRLDCSVSSVWKTVSFKAGPVPSASENLLTLRFSRLNTVTIDEISVVPVDGNSPAPTPTPSPTPTPTPAPTPTSTYTTLHVDGTQLRDANGHIVILRGFYCHSDQWGSMNENQFVYMKQWGANAVVIGMFGWDLEANMKNYGTYLPPAYLAKLDSFINYAQNSGLYVILRWHHDGNCAHGKDRKDMSHYMLGNDLDPTYADWINLWTTIATRYAGKGLLYAIACEPLYWAADTAQTQMQRARNAITNADPTAIVICPEYCEGTWGTTDMDIYLSHPISGSNVIYSLDIYGFHFTSNSQADIKSRLSSRGASALLAAGKCVFAEEFGGLSDGCTHYEEDYYWTSEVAAFSGPWLNNFMTVMDANGYSGYIAWKWGYTGGSDAIGVCADWNGNPNAYGKVIRSYYLAHR